MLKVSSISSRWNTADMDAHERNSVYINELGCTMDKAWGSLKKSWRQLKYNLTIGDFDRVETLKARITNLSDAMGLKNEELYWYWVWISCYFLYYRSIWFQISR